MNSISKALLEQGLFGYTYDYLHHATAEQTLQFAVRNDPLFFFRLLFVCNSVQILNQSQASYITVPDCVYRIGKKRMPQQLAMSAALFCKIKDARGEHLDPRGRHVAFCATLAEELAKNVRRFCCVDPAVCWSLTAIQGLLADFYIPLMMPQLSLDQTLTVLQKEGAVSDNFISLNRGTNNTVSADIAYIARYCAAITDPFAAKFKPLDWDQERFERFPLAMVQIKSIVQKVLEQSTTGNNTTVSL